MWQVHTNTRTYNKRFPLKRVFNQYIKGDNGPCLFILLEFYTVTVSGPENSMRLGVEIGVPCVPHPVTMKQLQILVG